MSIDISAETLIHRDRAVVASFVMNPENDPVWLGGVREATTLTEIPFGKGTRVKRRASFLGKSFEYVNEVVAYEPDSLLVMQSLESPFQMRITYQFEERDSGTLARIRVEGETNGFYRLARPLLARMVKRSVTHDLATLGDLLEADGDEESHPA